MIVFTKCFIFYLWLSSEYVSIYAWRLGFGLWSCLSMEIYGSGKSAFWRTGQRESAFWHILCHVTDFVLNKVPCGLTFRKFYKLFKSRAEWMLLKLAYQKKIILFHFEKNNYIKLFVVTRCCLVHQSCQW